MNYIYKQYEIEKRKKINAAAVTNLAEATALSFSLSFLICLCFILLLFSNCFVCEIINRNKSVAKHVRLTTDTIIELIIKRIT